MFRIAVAENAARTTTGQIGAVSDIVNDVMFDYARESQTAFENQIRQFVPFWTWARRNIPATASFAMRKPGMASKLIAGPAMAFSEDEQGNSIDWNEYQDRWRQMPEMYRQMGMPIIGQDSFMSLKTPVQDPLNLLSIIEEAKQGDKWGMAKEGRQALWDMLGPEWKMMAEATTGFDQEGQTTVLITNNSRIPYNITLSDGMKLKIDPNHSAKLSGNHNQIISASGYNYDGSPINHTGE